MSLKLRCGRHRRPRCCRTRARPPSAPGSQPFPRQAKTREELARAADAALYWSKRHGKNQLFAFDPSVVGLSWSRELAESVEYDARLRATESLIRVVDARDTYTGSHSQSVAVLVEAIGQAMGFDEATVYQLRLAGLLHDLGKIAVPDQILQKPGRLDPEEFAVLRKHPQDGYDLLQGLDIAPVDRWILHHHENWDGSGYPHGLAGDDIPIGSRIILVADAFDAITSERIYRRASPVAVALAELRRFAGTQFDPAVVDALERSLGRRRARRARAGRPGRVILALAGLLAVVVGTAFGGRVGRARRAALPRDVAASSLALAAQVAAFPSGALPWHTGDAVATLLWVGSYALLIAATFANGHIHGIGFVAVGMACNLGGDPGERRAHAGPARTPRPPPASKACMRTAPRWPIPTSRCSSTAGSRPAGCRSPTSSRSAT